MKKNMMLVPDYARQEILGTMVAEKGVSFGTSVLSLGVYKNSLLPLAGNREQEYSVLYRDIRNNISKNNMFINQLRFPAFFDYFYSFANELARQGLSADSLPEDNEMDRDKKEILSWILSHDLLSKDLHDAFEKVENAEGITIYDYNYEDFSDWKEIQELLGKGAREKKTVPHRNTVFSCLRANNSVREVTGIAQYIIANHLDLSDLVIMVTDMDAYLPLIRRTFKYYNIPFKAEYTSPSREAARFLSLLDLVRRQDVESFGIAYINKVFSENNSTLLNFIDRYKLTYRQLCDPLNHLPEMSEDSENLIDNTVGKKRLYAELQKQQQCERIMAPIRELLNSEEFVSLQKKSLREQVLFVYEYLYGNKKDDEHVEEINKIHDVCSDVLSLGDEELVSVLYSRLNRLTVSTAENYEDGVLITSPYEYHLNKRKAIIAGCIQSDYPRSVSYDGFFDEEYIARVRGFETLVDRNAHFEREYDRLLHSFDEVIFSYPGADIAGKKNQRSFFINRYIDNVDQDSDEMWPYSESDSYYHPSESISKATARRIYLQNGILPASPSSFESYVRCPFRYFLEKGVKLDSEEEMEIGSNVIGSIQHRLMEAWFNGDIDLSSENLKDMDEEYFDFLKDIFINQKEEVSAIKDRLERGLVFALDFLQEFKNRDDHDYQAEKKINHRLNHDDITLHIKGTIDRLDRKGNSFRIIDYKSSEKTIDMKNVRKGINIQLLTYLAVCCLEDDRLKPELMAYLSLKNSVVKGRLPSDDERKLRMDEIRYAAYAIDDASADEEMFKVKNTFTLDEIKDVTVRLYGIIADRILSGDISIDPKDGVCRFCHLKDVCHSTVEPLAASEMEDLLGGN